MSKLTGKIIFNIILVLSDYMLVIKPRIFQTYPEIQFGFSTKIGRDSSPPYNFNLSLSVGDDKKTVLKNREEFFRFAGISPDNIVIQKQVHSDIVTYVTEPGITGESDAIITDKENLGLAISVADCTPIFMYDPKKKIIAAVHSGWRGTEKKILLNTLEKMSAMFNCDPADIVVYVGPSISWKNYEVGSEVAILFEEKYLLEKNDKYLLDVAGVNYDILIKFGIRMENIQVSSLCTYEEHDLLHSYRREGKTSGRAYGVIAMDLNRIVAQ